LELEPRRLQVLAAGERDDVRAGIHARDVARRAEGDPQPLALADGVAGRAGVLPYPIAQLVDDRAGLGRPAGPRTERAADVAIGDEADALALRLRGGRQAEVAGDLPDLRLGQLAEGEPGVGELLLPEPVQEVGLVLVLVAGAAHLGPSLRVRAA